MVKTRRKDVEPSRHQTRRLYTDNDERDQGGDSFYDNLSNNTDSAAVKGDGVGEGVEGHSESDEFKSDLEDTNRERELRSRFSNRKFSTSASYSRHKHENRATNRKDSVNKRALVVYRTSRKILNDQSDADSPPLMHHRNRHDIHKQYRRSLSLRPIKRKLYTDKCYLTDSHPEEDNMSVRRSSRIIGNRRNYNMSWLVDEQMHKVGYPNLDAKYYDEDSSDAEMPNNHLLKDPYPPLGNAYCHQGTGTASGDSVTDTDEYIPPSHIAANTNAQLRLGLRGSKSSRLQRDKENTGANINATPAEAEKSPSAKTTRQQTSSKINCVDDDAISRMDNVREEVDESTVAVPIGRRTRGTYVRPRIDSQDSHEEEEGGFVDASVTPGVNVQSQVEAEVQMINDRGSSSSSEVNRKRYSLRNRAKKNYNRSPIIISSNRHSQHRFSFRRRNPLPQHSSSSSSSNSDNNEYRTPKKYINSKSLYAKNDHKKNVSNSSKYNTIQPEQMDGSVRFSSVGGLNYHVQCLKEMILLPMMYPEVFNQFQIEPPRGILFHGPPGTGKTLIARALANECSFGTRKLSFFMRKGADLLCKWVGESEKQLRLLFDQACELKPSIIFFDELDGLAPVRSARNDQFHASIVSTLLALMDGLNNRGEVIVIGATNRIDAIDPALRRPGRFDRELYFPLPVLKEREEILKVHVSKWQCPPSDHLITYLAESAVGYCGSDLRALCSEAVIQSFRRVYPQVYAADHILMLNPENVKVERIDFLRAKSMLVPAAHRVVQNLGRKLLPILTPLLEGPIKDILNILGRSFPHGVNPALAKIKLSAGYKPAQLLLSGDSADHGQTSYLAPALLHHMEHIHTHSLDLAALFRQSGISPEEACIQVFREAKRNVPSIIYIPCVNSFWELASRAVQAIFLAQVASMDPNRPILILATSDIAYADLEPSLQTVFSHYRHELYRLVHSSRATRADFFRPLISGASLRAVRRLRAVRAHTPPPLPRAPTPPPPPLSPDTLQRIFEVEERTVRQLRIFLREICKKLANNKLFFIFTKPVDINEVPDYPTIIKVPMDLETMMTKVDLYSYQCAKDFLADIELICQNALEYNPAKTSTDKQIRHRACSLRDYAFTLIRNEMDSDFEDKCQHISKKRKERKVSMTQYLSPYLHTAATLNILPHTTTTPTPTTVQTTVPPDPLLASVPTDCGTATTATLNNINTATNPPHNSSTVNTVRTTSSSGRKHRIPNWQRGYVTSSKHRRQQRSQRSLPIFNAVVKKEINCEGKSSLGVEVNNALDDGLITKRDLVVTADAVAAGNNKNAGVYKEHGNVTEHDMNPSHMQQLRIDTDVADVDSLHCSASERSKADLHPGLSKSSTCKRRLSDLLSPSELLNDHLEFDDIDQTLNETGSSSSQVPIRVSKSALNDVLKKVLDATNEQPLQVLLDIYYQLSRIVKMYSATHNRRQLPQDLLKELARFNEEKERRKCSLNEPEFSL